MFKLPRTATAPFCPSEVRGSVLISSASPLWRRMLRMAGPRLLVSVGYMDPGNWATDIAAGSAYGYALLWVVLVSSLSAILLQTLSVRLGLVTRTDLARACREHYRAGVNRFLWAMAELAIIACDVAEVLGSALALRLLLGVPILVGIALTAFDTLLVLGLQGKGFRQVEAKIVQTRHVAPDERSRTDAIRLATLDTVVSFSLAFVVNAAILALAASAFHVAGRRPVTDIQDAYHLLDPLVGGSLASLLFGVALLAAPRHHPRPGAGPGIRRGALAW